MTNPFDYVNTILVTKENMMRDSANDKLAEDGYNPWLTNTALSNYSDTVLVANLLNTLHYLPKRAQYEIGINTVRSKKRPFKKWAKQAVNEDLDIVCDVYKCNKTVGKEYLSLLSPDQVEALKKRRNIGGKQ